MRLCLQAEVNASNIAKDYCKSSLLHGTGGTVLAYILELSHLYCVCGSFTKLKPGKELLVCYSWLMLAILYYYRCLFDNQR